MSNDTVAILGMIAVTLALRVAGLMLGDRVPASGPVRRVLDAVPGCLLVALVAPAVPQGGWITIAGAALVVVVMVVSRRTLLALIAGIAWVALARSLV